MDGETCVRVDSTITYTVREKPPKLAVTAIYVPLERGARRPTFTAAAPAKCSSWQEGLKRHWSL